MPSRPTTISRRSVVKLIAGAATAPMFAPSRLLGADAPSRLMRLGQIGCGRMGHGDMRAAAHQGLSAGARVVAVCDVDSNRTANAARSLRAVYKQKLGDEPVTIETYGDYRELLQRRDIDGVLISTPDHWHALPAIAAANAGKDIYLQKPLTYSVAEGQKLVAAVRRNKVILQTGSQQRSEPGFRHACELVRNGYLGKLQSIELALPADSGHGRDTVMPVPPHLDYDMWLGPTPEAEYTEHRVHPERSFGRPGWLQIEAYCRGMITGWGAHMYDIAQWGLGVDHDGGPIRVRASAAFPDRGLFDVHTNYSAEAEYANGVKLLSQTGSPGVKFIGADGWVRVWRGGREAHDPELLNRKIDGGVSLYRSSDHMLDFLKAMRSRKDPICPVEVGHRSNSVCIIHHIAMKLGRPLNWDAKAERFVNDEQANGMLDYPHRVPWTV